MPNTFSSNHIHQSDFFKFDRKYLRKQESQNAGQKVFHRDTLEISQLSNNGEEIMDRVKHMVEQFSLILFVGRGRKKIDTVSQCIH